jgi:hypothetical protein
MSSFAAGSAKYARMIASRASFSITCPRERPGGNPYLRSRYAKNRTVSSLIQMVVRLFISLLSFNLAGHVLDKMTTHHADDYSNYRIIKSFHVILLSCGKKPTLIVSVIFYVKTT